MAGKTINLLPKELSVSKTVVDLSAKIKKTAWGFFVFFIFILASFSGAFYYFNNQLTNLEEEQNRLKTNIQSLQETEEQLIITKDRIAKVKTILDSRVNEERFKKHKLVVDNMKPTMELEASDLTSSNSNITLNALNSKELVSFMNVIISRADVLSVVMDSLSFNPFLGYSIDLEVF